MKEGQQRVILGDKNYFSEDTLQACAKRDIEGIIPDSREKCRLEPSKKKEFRGRIFRILRKGIITNAPLGRNLNIRGKSNEQRGRRGKSIRRMRKIAGYARIMRNA